MQSRRKLLLGLGSATAISLAGCSENARSAPAEDDIDSQLQAFHPAEENVCTSRDEGEIMINQHPDFANQLSFEGTLLTPNPCYEAEIAEENYDEESGVYTITIGAAEAGADSCQDCIGETTYSGGMNFEGDYPIAVRIEHAPESDDAATEVEL